MEMNHIQISTLPNAVSKAQLAKLLNTDRSNLYNYHEVAMCLSDFAWNYPLDINDEPITKSPLSTYQCWVIYQIIQISRKCSISDLYEIPKAKLRKPVRNFLSRERYELLKSSDNLEKEENSQTVFLSNDWLNIYKG